MDSSLLQTPLHARHVALGARMMPFGGYDMPVQYSSIIDEHLAVRERAGLFDVSHMGEVLVRGPEAFAFVQHLVTNDASRLDNGRAMYTTMCTPEGGILDDLLVYRLAEDVYLLVINAANIEKDVAWMRANNPMGASLDDVSANMGLLALQGPRAFDVLEAATGVALHDLPFYRFTVLEPGTFFNSEFALISHTGYTGERGVEIYCDAAVVGDVWDALLDNGEAYGLQPAGLGARDTLRLEAGYCLYGNDLSQDINPLEAGLGWVTKLDKGPFIGRDRLQAIKQEGTARKLVGFVMSERGIPRQGHDIVDAEGTPIGIVTSGTQSPILQQGIGLGYVPNDPTYTTPGASLGILSRGRVRSAVVQKPPFHKD